MKRSTRLQALRILVAAMVVGLLVWMSERPVFVVPGLLVIVGLLFVQSKLWRAVSAAVVQEQEEERRR